jgi:cytochrome c-type biogenesis protein
MNELGNFPVIASFTAGILTFVSPCVLPLMPAYLSFITGASIAELKTTGGAGKNTVLSAVFFVLGFGFVFTLLGASATWAGNLLFRYRDAIRLAGGLIIILFGLHLAGIIRIPFLYYEKRMEVKKSSLGLFSVFLMGNAFALGWTPCVGPILSSILLLASTEQSLGRGVLLLGSFSLGLGIPLILTAVFVNRAIMLFSKIKKYYRAVELISGFTLVAIGFILLTNNMTRLNAFFNGLF